MRFFFNCMLVVAIFSGCGSSDGKVSATGKVMWNGAPLETGRISFLIPEKTSDAVDINNGEFSLRIHPGRYNVGITAYKQVKVNTDRGESLYDYQYLPTEYNDRSTLSADVKAGEALQFDLKGSEVAAPQNFSDQKGSPPSQAPSRRR